MTYKKISYSLTSYNWQSRKRSRGWYAGKKTKTKNNSPGFLNFEENYKSTDPKSLSPKNFCKGRYKLSFVNNMILCLNI